MPQGFEVYDAPGTKVMVTSDVQSFVLKRTGSGTTVATGFPANYTVPSLGEVPVDVSGMTAPLVAVTNADGMAFIGLASGTNRPRYACQGAVGSAFNWYLFEQVTEVPDTHIGLEAYNAAGQRTFTSAMRHMKPLHVMVSSGGFGAGNQFQAVGKSLAAVMMSWAGEEIWPTNGMCHDTSPADPWEAGGGFCADLRINQDADAFGVKIVNGGDTAQFQAVSWQDITINTSSTGYTSHVNQTVDLRSIIVDVTDIPLGVTYF